jgi:lysozyme family protein
MTTDYFLTAYKQVFGEEGGPSDDPVNDPAGGLTRFGISQVQHPDVDVAGLTQATAAAWYRANMWDATRCGEMPWPVCLAVFDTSVNPRLGFDGARSLQQALGVAIDGDIGEQTMTALRAADPWDLSARIIAKRAARYASSPLFDRDGEGWMYRLASLAIACGRGLTA